VPNLATDPNLFEQLAAGTIVVENANRTGEALHLLHLSASECADVGLLALRPSAIVTDVPAPLLDRLESIGVSCASKKPTAPGSSAEPRDAQARFDHVNKLTVCEYQLAGSSAAVQLATVAEGSPAAMLALELLRLATTRGLVVWVILQVRSSVEENAMDAQLSPLSIWLSHALAIACKELPGLKVRVRVIAERGSADHHDAATARPFFTKMHALLDGADASGIVVLSADPMRLVRALGDQAELAALLTQARGRGVRFLALFAPGALSSLRKSAKLGVDAPVPYEALASCASAATHGKALYGARQRSYVRALKSATSKGKLATQVGDVNKLVVRLAREAPDFREAATVVAARESPNGTADDPVGARACLAQGAAAVALTGLGANVGVKVYGFSGPSGQSAPAADDGDKPLEQLVLNEWPMWARVFSVLQDPTKRLIVVATALDRLTRDERYLDALLKLIRDGRLIVIVLNVSRDLFNGVMEAAAKLDGAMPLADKVIDVMLPGMRALAVAPADAQLLQRHGRFLTWLYERQTSRDFAGTSPNMQLPLALHDNNAGALRSHIRSSAAAYRRVFLMSASLRRLHGRGLRLRRLQRSLRLRSQQQKKRKFN
jgi:hypothetical protein